MGRKCERNIFEMKIERKKEEEKENEIDIMKKVFRNGSILYNTHKHRRDYEFNNAAVD